MILKFKDYADISSVRRVLSFDLNIGVKSTSENIAGSKHFKKFGRDLKRLDLAGDGQLDKISEHDFEHGSNSEDHGSRKSLQDVKSEKSLELPKGIELDVQEEHSKLEKGKARRVTIT